MKQITNSKRQRGGRPNGRRPHFGHSGTFESAGPEVKIKGSASQVLERYQALARDALASGDRVAAENFFQHAEHYYRVINASNQVGASQSAPGHGQQPSGNGDGSMRPRGDSRGPIVSDPDDDGPAGHDSSGTS